MAKRQTRRGLRSKEVKRTKTPKLLKQAANYVRFTYIDSPKRNFHALTGGKFKSKGVAKKSKQTRRSRRKR